MYASLFDRERLKNRPAIFNDFLLNCDAVIYVGL